MDSGTVAPAPGATIATVGAVDRRSSRQAEYTYVAAGWPAASRHPNRASYTTSNTRSVARVWSGVRPAVTG